ncbi:hypothetical protein EWM64_g6127 [Hericium alpestre]|uniref:Uncharacterized protein n=1 Tax=Hericium alpestre TaxID=135208 RepID=A0A4Y9ZTI3_9AGAM|nr:hypothetical protein EWM64_g6127 [Hericium alpestre]
MRSTARLLITRFGLSVLKKNISGSTWRSRAWQHGYMTNDEDNDIADAIHCLESEGDRLLAAELCVFGTHRRQVNDIHRIHIQQIYALPYFKGDQRVSIMLERQGEDAMELGDPPIELDADAHTREDEEDGLDAAKDDDIAEQLYALSSFMEDLALITEPGEMAF